MNVLSLFDGLSGGQIAVERAEIEVGNYFASEIDKYAIKVAQHNYPNTQQLGSVLEYDKWDLPKINLLMGGSPCQDLSRIKSTDGKGLQGDKSSLFFSYYNALEKFSPSYFLLENVVMGKADETIITKLLGIEPILIDSGDFSAQNRKRYYWTNIPVKEWEPKNILFSDIMDDTWEKERSIAEYADTYKWSKDGSTIKWDTGRKGHYSQANRAKKVENKWYTVCAVRAESKGNVWLGNDKIRLVTISELEKLQTLPVGYTSCLKSKEKRGKGIGNGWTIDVIAHILGGLK